MAKARRVLIRSTAITSLFVCLFSIWGYTAEEPELERRDEQSPPQISAKGSAQRTPQQLLTYGEWLLEDSPQKALVVFDQFLKQYPEDSLSCRAELGRGRAFFALDQLEEAFASIELSFPPVPEIHALAIRCGFELMIGNRLLIKGMDSLDEKKSQKKSPPPLKASRVFSAVLYNDPQGIHAPAALLGLGKAELLQNHDPEKARIALLRLVHEHSDNELCTEAKIFACRAILDEMDAKRRYDASNLMMIEKLAGEAGEVRFQNRPWLVSELELVNKRLNEVKAEQLFVQSQQYKRHKGNQGRQSSHFLYQRILTEYPETKAAAKAKECLTATGEPLTGEKQ